MTQTETFEVPHLEELKARESGCGPRNSEVKYLKIGNDTLVYRWSSNMSYTGQNGRWGPETTHTFWYNVFGWKASEPYYSEKDKAMAIRVRAVRELDKEFVEAQLRAVPTIGISPRILFSDWSSE